MERNNGVKSNEVISNLHIVNIHTIETKQKKVDLAYHYIVPWELVEDDDVSEPKEKY